MASSRGTTSTPPPIIGKAGRYTVFITPPKAPEKTAEKPPEKVAPPVQPPPQQFEKVPPEKPPASGFGFFWNAVAKVQRVHSTVDDYLADWFGLNQSKYQWALNDYYESKGLVAGVPGVTEALFQARLTALAEERKKLDETRMQYTCTVCNREYRSAKAHAQHVKSRSHIARCQAGDAESSRITIIKPLPDHSSNKPASMGKELAQSEVESDNNEDSEGEWEEVDPDELTAREAAEAMMNLNVTELAGDSDLVIDGNLDGASWDPSQCFICDLNPDNTVESCVVHMHKGHGFYIPDAEYLKDPKGLLAHVAMRVTRDFLCLYCNDKRQPFVSLEAVRKHMISKSHCKLNYGEGDDDEDAELEEFYDYTSSYADETGKQLVSVDDESSNVELGYGGELMITRKTEAGISTRALGSREFMRYYRQKPRPTSERDIALSRALVSRYHEMGLSTVQSKGGLLRMKVLKEMKRSGLEAMRTKVGIKNNVIRNLPKNVPY